VVLLSRERRWWFLDFYGEFLAKVNIRFVDVDVESCNVHPAFLLPMFLAPGGGGSTGLG